MKNNAARVRHVSIPVFVIGLLAALVVSAGTTQSNPEEVADSLHQALTQGDAEKVREVLHPEVLIFESGGVEQSLEEYASHHMHSDMDFLAEIDSELLSRQVFEGENVVVISSRSRLTGTFRDKAVDLFSTETLVLGSTEKGWKVRHIHWSSKANK